MSDLSRIEWEFERRIERDEQIEAAMRRMRARNARRNRMPDRVAAAEPVVEGELVLPGRAELQPAFDEGSTPQLARECLAQLSELTRRAHAHELSDFMIDEMRRVVHERVNGVIARIRNEEHHQARMEKVCNELEMGKLLWEAMVDPRVNPIQVELLWETFQSYRREAERDIETYFLALEG